MCKIISVLFLLLFGQVFIVKTQYIATRVVEGSPTTITLYPIVAQFLLDPWGDHQFTQHCAGVILTSRHIISTAHCFQYNYNTMKNYTNPKYWRIRVGSSYRSSGGVIHSLKKIITHPDFDRFYYTNDVAVVVVTKKFAFSNSIAQATIAKYKSELRDGVLCTLIGWGSMESTGPQSEQLQQTMMFTINQDECRQRYKRLGTAIVDSMLCAGKLDIGGADGCFGDSGGPLIYKRVVVGLVSFGFNCGHRYYPGVYTKIGHFTNWIVNTIDNNK